MLQYYQYLDLTEVFFCFDVGSEAAESGKEDVMSRETIFQLKEAEAEAARIVAQAKAKADQMRADAEEAGQALCLETERSVSEELAGMLEQIREKAEEHRERVLEETRAEAEVVAANVRLNRKSAEKIVIRGLDTKCR